MKFNVEWATYENGKFAGYEKKTYDTEILDKKVITDIDIYETIIMYAALDRSDKKLHAIWIQADNYFNLIWADFPHDSAPEILGLGKEKEDGIQD